MRKIIFINLLFLVTVSGFSQVKGDYIWTLGDGQYDGPGDEYSGMMLDFHTTPPSIIPTSIPMNEPLAFICDSSGNLVAYTNGCRISNGSHAIIENGDSLNPGYWFNLFCEEVSYPSGYQSNLFLQLPGSDHLFYLFHIRKNDNSLPYQLMYTLTDISQNGGLGKVIAKNQLIQEALFTPYNTAVRHGNGRDWWIVVPRLGTNGYTILLLTPEGIQGPFLQEIGTVPPLSSSCCGQTAFSADGGKYFKFLPFSGLQILDFDRCSGQFSNPLYIDYRPDSLGLGGVVGSPNSRFLYLSTGQYMYQYDLYSSNIPASRQTVGVYDGYVNPFPAGFYQGARGPDGKIYHISNNGVKVMHVMHNPDELGMACNFEQHGILLPAHQSFFMPNFANYRLYDVPGSPCDTLGIDAPTVATGEVPLLPGALRAMPNPSTGMVQLTLPEGIADATLRVLDVSGRVVLERQVSSDALISIDMRRQPQGIYWILVRDNRTSEQSVVKVSIQR
jgi:Secretion system C-terminal sorting domain